MSRLILCGSRFWVDPHPIRNKLAEVRKVMGYEGVTIVHGGARGADHMAGALAKTFGFEVEVHPALWTRYGVRAAGGVRNAKMLDSGVDAIIAFKSGFDRSLNRGGTEGMIEMGLLNDIPCEVWGHAGEDEGGEATYRMFVPELPPKRWG